MGLFFDSKKEKERNAAANRAREAKRARARRTEQKNLADAERRISLARVGRGEVGLIDRASARHTLRQAENSRDTAKRNLKGLE